MSFELDTPRFLANLTTGLLERPYIVMGNMLSVVFPFFHLIFFQRFVFSGSHGISA